MGLDISATGTGVVVIDGDAGRKPKLVVEYEISTKKLTGMARISEIASKIIATMTDHAPSKIVVEDYAVGKFAGSAIVSIEVGAIVRYFMAQYEQKIGLVSPTALKKFVSGKGTSKKEQMMMHILQRWGHASLTNNTADAYGLAVMGLAHGGLLLGVTALQKEIIGAVKFKIP